MDRQIGQRETYLDVIKGIAMLLVVMQHVGGRLNEGMIFLCKVDVPLFFLVSGYLAYKPCIDYRKDFVKKINRLFCPFLVASIFAIIYYKLPFQNYILDIGKCGYWFLECLFIMFLLFYILHKLNCLLNNNVLIIGFLIIEFCLLIFSKYGLETIDNVFGISYLSRYFPCFMVGVIIKKYSIQQMSKMIGSTLFLVTCATFLYNNVDTNINFLLHVLGYVCASSLLFYFIRNVETEIPYYARNLLSIIGKNSLSIYIIHFYFVEYLASSTGYFIIDFTLVLCISLMIIFLSIILQKILSKMTYLYKIF